MIRLGTASLCAVVLSGCLPWASWDEWEKAQNAEKRDSGDTGRYREYYGEYGGYGEYGTYTETTTRTGSPSNACAPRYDLDGTLVDWGVGCGPGDVVTPFPAQRTRIRHGR